MIRYITIPSLLPTFFVLLMMNIGNFLSNGMEQYYVAERNGVDQYPTDKIRKRRNRLYKFTERNTMYFIQKYCSQNILQYCK